MLLIATFCEGIPFLLCVIDIYGKYACVLSLKDKRCITITIVFKKS